LLDEAHGRFPTDGEGRHEIAAKVVETSSLEWKAKVQRKRNDLSKNRLFEMGSTGAERRDAVSGEVDPETTTMVAGALFIVPSRPRHKFFQPSRFLIQS
jgi:hypothetical protein